MADTITYEQIKSRDVSDMLSAGNRTSNAEDNLSNNQGKLWGNLCGALEGKLDWSALEGMEDKKEIRTAIQKQIKKDIVASGIALDTNEKGKVAWSSDKKTRGIMKYTSDIAKIVACGMSGELLPGDDTVASRCSILKACKTEETALQAIKRAITAIDNAMDKALPSEYSDIMDCFQTLSVHIATVKA